MIYLDYAANAPVDEEVLESYINATKKYFANPNSFHRLGLEAKKAIDDASSNMPSKIMPRNSLVFRIYSLSTSITLRVSS